MPILRKRGQSWTHANACWRAEHIHMAGKEGWTCGTPSHHRVLAFNEQVHGKEVEAITQVMNPTFLPTVRVRIHRKMSLKLKCRRRQKQPSYMLKWQPFQTALVVFRVQPTHHNGTNGLNPNWGRLAGQKVQQQKDPEKMLLLFFSYLPVYSIIS